MTRCMNCGEDIEEEKCKCCEEDIAIFVKKKQESELKSMLLADITDLKEKLVYLSVKHIVKPIWRLEEDKKPIPMKLRAVRNILKEKIIIYKMIIETEEIRGKGEANGTNTNITARN